MIKTAGFWFDFVLGFLFCFVVVTVHFFHFPKVWSLWLSIHEHLLLELCISLCWVQIRDSRASWYDQHPLLSLSICHSAGLDQSQNFLLILTKSECVSNETGRKVVTFRIFRHCIWTKPFGRCKYLIEYLISASQNTQAHAEVRLISGGWRNVLLDMLKRLEAAHGRLSSKARLSWQEEKLQEEISVALPYTHGE